MICIGNVSRQTFQGIQAKINDIAGNRLVAELAVICVKKDLAWIVRGGAKGSKHVTVKRLDHWPKHVFQVDYLRTPTQGCRPLITRN